MVEWRTLELIDYALARYEKAKRSREKVYVTQIAGRFSRGQGRGVEAGKKLHDRIWGFDPYDIIQHEELCTPFPLAWRFRFGWLLGVADQVCFKRGIPYAVVEYKSYNKIRKAELVQASLYGLLVMLNFANRPFVYLKVSGSLHRIEKWEILALEGIDRIRKKTRRNLFLMF